MNIEINDFEHEVRNKINWGKGRPSFPSLEDYHITSSDLDDYLFDKQAILDKNADLRTTYTVWGILIVLCIVIMSFFISNNTVSLFTGIGIGVVCCIIYEMLKRMIKSIRLKRLANPQIDKYINDVLSYKK